MLKKEKTRESSTKGHKIRRWTVELLFINLFRKRCASKLIQLERMREIISRERINDSLADITLELIKSTTTLWSFYLMILQHFGHRYGGLSVISEKKKIEYNLCAEVINLFLTMRHKLI